VVIEVPALCGGGARATKINGFWFDCIPDEQLVDFLLSYFLIQMRTFSEIGRRESHFFCKIQ
jgi:hypothetical protein